MTPGARIEAVIELCRLIDATTRPADAVADRYFRERRYMGSKDRRAVADGVFAMLRRRARLDWWIAHAGDGIEAAPRGRAIANLVLFEETDGTELPSLFGGTGHCPAPLSAGEAAFAAALRGQPAEHPQMPETTALELPAWLDEPLRRQWGAALGPEMEALNLPAPVDLRVNTVKATREEAGAVLAADGIESDPTPLSPLGLRAGGRPRLGGAEAFRQGLVEVQDEGAQITALLTGARPGMTVVDFCAGAGGKTLLLAAAMARGSRVEGRLSACDTAAGRLQRMEGRLRRAGISGVKRRTLEGENDSWMLGNQASADRVLVDVPCSGTGTWRRHPEARWRLSAADVDGHARRQRKILAGAAGLVRRGGRLVYVTCSLLPAENNEQVSRFLDDHPDFALVPAAEAWAETLGGRCPADGLTLSLSPATTGTDGFFAAVLERRAGE